MSLWKKICEPSGANANVLIRLVVGGVFLNEGILKFLYPVAQAAGRFAKIGIPDPHFLARLWPRWKPFAVRCLFSACSRGQPPSHCSLTLRWRSLPRKSPFYWGTVFSVLR